MNKNQILTLILGTAIVPGIVLTILIRKQKENNNEKRLPETVSKNTKNSTPPIFEVFLSWQIRLV